MPRSRSPKNASGPRRLHGDSVPSPASRSAARRLRKPAEGAPLDPLTFFRLTDGRYAVADGAGRSPWHHDVRLSGNYLQQLDARARGPRILSALLLERRISWGFDRRIRC